MKLTLSVLLLFCNLVFAQTKNEKADHFFELAEVAVSKQNYSEALDLLQQCVQQNPGYSEAYLSMGYVKQQLKDYEGAIVDFSIYLEQRPNQPEVLFSRATLYYQLSQYNQSKADLLKLLTLPSGETNTVYFKKPAESTSGVTQVFSAQSGMISQVCNYLGLVEIKLKSFPSAIIWLDSAIVLEPNQADYYVNRALAKEGNNDSTAALADYQKALSINPNHALALNNLSVLNRSKGNTAGADDELDMAIDSDSSMLYPYLERAYQRMEGGYYKGAIEDYNSALKINDRDPEIWLNRGLAKEKLKDLVGAYADFTKAISLKENFDKAWLSRGNVLTKQSRYTDAIDDYTAAITFNPNYALAYYNRAIAKEKLKLPTEACDDLKKAIDLGLQIEARVRAKFCGKENN